MPRSHGSGTQVEERVVDLGAQKLGDLGHDLSLLLALASLPANRGCECIPC